MSQYVLFLRALLAHVDQIKALFDEDQEQVIAHLQQGLSVWTRETNPADWAISHHHLGTAYEERLRGERAKNLEQAILHYQQALSVWTRETNPEDWARTQQNLGAIYSERIYGDRGDNLEHMITHYQQALSVWTREATPADWAISHHHLGTAYEERLRGERAKNLEQAILHYQQALSVWTRETNPEDWATAQSHLGSAYEKRVHGERAENLEQAIAHYHQILQLHTRESGQKDWGSVFRDDAQGQSTANWPNLLIRLNGLLSDLLSERNEEALAARVNQIYRCFYGTSAESLVRKLFQQAHEQAGHVIPGLPPSQSRSLDLSTPKTTHLPIDTTELRVAAHEFSHSIRERSFEARESETQHVEKHINAWISERTDEPSRPLDIGEQYTLNLSVGMEIAASLIGEKDSTVLNQDLTSGGLQTEWIISTVAFDISSDSPAIMLDSKAPRLYTATFSLLIPDKGESEVRQLFIVPRSRDNGRLEVLIYAIKTNRRELYRQLAIEVPVEGSTRAGAPVSPTTVVGEVRFAPGHQMNLRSTREWTRPPGKVMLAVPRDPSDADLRGNVGAKLVRAHGAVHANPLILAKSIEHARGTAEGFRGKQTAYLNDIDPQDLMTRISGFTPTYDWANWQCRADVQHTKNWTDVSTSDELRKLAVSGHALYQTLFPRDEPLRRTIDSLPLGTRLEINWTVDGPGSGSPLNVPWGLMYVPPPPDAGKAVDPMGFLALRFRLEYWGYEGVLCASKALGAIDQVHQVNCLYWGCDPRDETGIEAAWQRQQFQLWPNQVCIPHFPNSPNAHEELQNAFAAPPRSPTPVFYFFCQAGVEKGMEQVLRFGPTSAPTDVIQMIDLLAGKDLVDQPLVFANACTTASTDLNILQQNFFQRGCRGFLGTETKVPIQLASRFASIFFNFFHRRIDAAPIAAGEAVAQTRLFLLTEYANIGGIFYTYLNQYELFMANESEVNALR